MKKKRRAPKKVASVASTALVPRNSSSHHHQKKKVGLLEDRCTDEHPKKMAVESDKDLSTNAEDEKKASSEGKDPDLENGPWGQEYFAFLTSKGYSLVMETPESCYDLYMEQGRFCEDTHVGLELELLVANSFIEDIYQGHLHMLSLRDGANNDRPMGCIFWRDVEEDDMQQWTQEQSLRVAIWEHEKEVDVKGIHPGAVPTHNPQPSHLPSNRHHSPVIVPMPSDCVEECTDLQPRKPQPRCKKSNEDGKRGNEGERDSGMLRKERELLRWSDHQLAALLQRFRLEEEASAGNRQINDPVNPKSLPRRRSVGRAGLSDKGAQKPKTLRTIGGCENLGDLTTATPMLVPPAFLSRQDLIAEILRCHSLHPHFPALPSPAPSTTAIGTASSFKGNRATGQPKSKSEPKLTSSPGASPRSGPMSSETTFPLCARTFPFLLSKPTPRAQRKRRTSAVGDIAKSWIKIELVCTHPDYYGRRVGTILLAACLVYAARHREQRAILHVAGGHDNLPALHLYERFGFFEPGKGFNYPNKNLFILPNIQDGLKDIDWQKLVEKVRNCTNAYFSFKARDAVV